LLLFALYGAVLGYFASVFWSLEPQSGELVRLVWWGLAVAWAIMACVPRTRSTRARPAWVGGLAWALKLPLILFVVAVLGWTHAYGYLTALFVSAFGTVAFALVEGLGLAVCLWRFFKVPEARPSTLAVGATLLFLGAMQFVFYALWMWSPAEREMCAEVTSSGQVQAISPPHWPAELSQPYSLLYVPEKQGLLASFKMAGNGALPFWNDPNANRILAYDVSEQHAPSVMPLQGPNYPIHLVYEPELDQLLVSRVGTDEHALDLLDLSGFPIMTRVNTLDVPYPPHDLVSHHDSGVFGVFTQHGTLNWVAQEDLAHRHSVSLGKHAGPATVTLNGWRAPGTTKVYVSMLLHSLVEVDIETRQVRWSEFRLGGGYLAGDTGLGELFVTDHLFNTIDVVDMKTLSVTRTLDVDYTPRPLLVDPARDLLMVGGWFDGLVRFYRMSTLEAVGPTVSFGAYLRDLAFDPERGLLFGASKCGVFQAPIDALVGTAAAN
jgi:hypothetical protein